MADWSKPALASSYANFVTETNARDTDLAAQFNPTYAASQSNLVAGTVQWLGSANKWRIWNGSVWNDLSSLYAINISGNAATASALSSAPGSVLEVGRYFDFHSAANGYDYDVRLDAQAGASAGAGTLVITASNVAATKFTGALVGNATTATNAGGSSFATQATAAEGQLIAQKSGQNPAYLFNNDSAWGLSSASGGTMVSYDRATAKFYFNGHAATATSAANGGVTSVNGQTGDVSIQGVPPGAVMHFAMTSPPTGWLAADGTAVSRSTYASLFSAIGTTFGVGNGTTTFALPDLRGEFVRGWDDGRGVDSGRALGGAQSWAIQNITGRANSDLVRFNLAATDGAFAAESMVSRSRPSSTTTSDTYGINFDASRVVQTANETRPRNVALLACIKF